MMNLFIFAFHWSTGSCAWLYVPEITVDSASGFGVGAQFTTLIVISLTFEFMMDSALQVYGSIWIFAGSSFVGFLFCLFFIRETRGLTDIEKKMLYSPKGVTDDSLTELQDQSAKINLVPTPELKSSE